LQRQFRCAPEACAGQCALKERQECLHFISW
jgi:hypothetical protein